MNRRETLASATGTLSVVLAFIIAAMGDSSTASLAVLFAAFAASAIASFILKG